jgi:CAP12/Pycsar effector protein, TIR domain
MSRPTVFIGSSREQLPTARALARQLGEFATATVWDRAPFELNQSIFDGLLHAAKDSDYAVFVFEPDDLAVVRDSNLRTVRDNVLFEFGLFVGRIGRERAFWISSHQSNWHVPTDLDGLTHLVYSRPTADEPAALANALTDAIQQLRKVIEQHGRRTDREFDELDNVKALCVASAEYDEPQFAEDIRHIRENFPPGSITSAHGVDADTLVGYFNSGQHWDIVHLAMYVDAGSGDLRVPDGNKTASQSVIRAEGVETLIKMSGARLVVVVTCDSLALAVRLARHTNTIAGHRPIDVQSALRWSSIFYPALALGCPLSEAFNRSQALSDPGLVLISKRDFRLTFHPN